MWKWLLHEYRTHRLARFTAWVLAFGAVLFVAGTLTHPTGDLIDLLWIGLWTCAIVSGVYYFIRLVRFIRSHFLWRLRRRLIVAYVLIGVVPVCLILVLFFIATFIINGQFAAFLVALRLRDHFDEIEQVNRVVLQEARFGGETSPAHMLDRIQKFYVTQLVSYSQSYPGLVITLDLANQSRSFLLNGQPTDGPSSVPSWIKGTEYANIVSDHGELALRSVEHAQTRAGDLTLVLSQPFSPELLDLVGLGIGPVGVATPRTFAGRKGRNVTVVVGASQAPKVLSTLINSRGIQLPTASNPFDFVVFGASSLDPIVWGGDSEESSDQPAFVYVSSRVFTLNKRLLSTLGDLTAAYVLVFKIVAVFFLLIEGVALFLGIRMTRSMTRTVDILYDATERVKAGNLSFRTHFPPEDQLTALGEAFDGMTASVERLMLESKERILMQSELDIAREVQRRLFPQSVPKISGLDLYGVCRAARSVSGDYYDFIKIDEHRVALVLGDVSGKGISAALLMASIQSALRALFYDALDGDPATNSFPVSPAIIVERLNQQLYANSPLEKYVTFFFAIYDSRSRKLRYTNAGHLPPLHLRDGTVTLLETGGTVVGMFPNVKFEVGEATLEPHDLLLAYTDGITEPENHYGEQFGETRLIEVTQRMSGAQPEVLVETLCQAVDEWTGSPELQDDMTVVLARAV
jgi:sigma-B regulation protein RsbU (phosphoserine phosphatase)